MEKTLKKALLQRKLVSFLQVTGHEINIYFSRKNMRKTDQENKENVAKFFIDLSQY